MGMILLDEGGGKRGGGNMVLDEMVLPSVRCQLLFLDLRAKVFFCLFAGVKKFKKMGS